MQGGNEYEIRVWDQRKHLEPVGSAAALSLLEREGTKAL
jgi:hypothetical protein